MDQSKSSEIMIQEDNPCWGSSQNCDLSYLLEKLNMDSVILFESSNYIVIDKPPDLRMDGNFRATLHKLLTYWFPSPSLKKSSNILDSVSRLHQHNDLKDNELRPCHQLDYATSGVLCVARTREAAAVAGRLFEDRKVQKSYLAIVHGRISVDESLPQLTRSKMEATIHALEKAYRDKKGKRKQNTFSGFQPPHALFQKYKSLLKAGDKRQNSNKRRRPSPLDEDQWIKIWEPIKKEGCDQSRLSNLDWKQLCKSHLDWKNAFKASSEIHNSLLREILENENKTDIPVLPPFFRIEGDENSIFIFCPIGQPTDEFGMKVPKDQCNRKDFLAGRDDLDYKPSLTKCTIIQSTRHNSEQVTKVQLWPITGRRHQLRVHMSLYGHSILGDMTYSTSDEQQRQHTAVPRMCLHSHSLSMALLGESEDWEITAQDPFPISNEKLAIDSRLIDR